MWSAKRSSGSRFANCDDGVRDIRISLPIFAAGADVTEQQWREFKTTTVVSTGPTDSKAIDVYPHKFGTDPRLVSAIPSEDGKYMYTPKNVSCFVISPRNNTLENAPFYVNSLLFAQATIEGVECTIIPSTASTAGGSGSIAIEETCNCAANNNPLTGIVACAKQWNAVTPSSTLIYNFPNATRTLRRSNQKEFDPSCDWGIINVTTAFPTSAVGADQIVQVASLNITLSVAFAEYTLSPLALAIPAMTLNGGSGGGSVSVWGFKSGSTGTTQPSYYQPGNTLQIKKGLNKKGCLQFSKDYAVDLGPFRKAILMSRDPLNHPLLKKALQSKNAIRALRADGDTLKSVYSTYNGLSMYSFGGAHQNLGNVNIGLAFFMDATNYDDIQALNTRHPDLYSRLQFQNTVNVFSCQVNSDPQDNTVLRKKTVGLASDANCYQSEYNYDPEATPESPEGFALGAFFYAGTNNAEYNDTLTAPIGIDFPLCIPLNAEQDKIDTIAQACAVPSGDAMVLPAEETVQTTSETTRNVPVSLTSSETVPVEIPNQTVQVNGFYPPATLEEVTTTAGSNGIVDGFIKVLGVAKQIFNDPNGGVGVYRTSPRVLNAPHPFIRRSGKLSVQPSDPSIRANPTEMGWFSVTIDKEIPRSTVGSTDSVMKAYTYLSDCGITLEDAYKYSIINPGNASNNQYLQAGFGGSVYTVLPVILGDAAGKIGAAVGKKWGSVLGMNQTTVPLYGSNGAKLSSLFSRASLDSSIGIFATRFPEDFKHAIQISPTGGATTVTRILSTAYSVGDGQVTEGNVNLVLKNKQNEVVSQGGVMVVFSGASQLQEQFRVNVPDKLPDENGVLQELKVGETFYLFATISSRLILESTPELVQNMPAGLDTSKAVLTMFPGFPQGFPNMQINNPALPSETQMDAIPLWHMEDASATGIYVDLDAEESS